WADDTLAGSPGRQTTDVRVANPKPTQLAAGGGAADLGQTFDQLLRWTYDVRCLDHGVSSYCKSAVSSRSIRQNACLLDVQAASCKSQAVIYNLRPVTCDL